MAVEGRIAEGARWIIVAEQEQQKSGWWQLFHAIGMDNAEGQAVAFLLFALFTMMVLRISRGMGKPSIAKAPPPQQQVGHLVAAAVGSTPLAKKEHLRVKTAKYAEPGRTLGSKTAVAAGQCAWKKVKPAEDDTPALWICGRCNATYQMVSPAVPMSCLRGQ